MEKQGGPRLRLALFALNSELANAVYKRDAQLLV